MILKTGLKKYLNLTKFVRSHFQIHSIVFWKY